METPKEKAEELVNKYLRTYPIYDNPTVVISYTNNEAKQCALIAVDEIIKAIPDASDDNSPYNSELLWWKEVRHEIENLKN
jgi:hypothetical protein